MRTILCETRWVSPSFGGGQYRRHNPVLNTFLKPCLLCVLPANTFRHRSCRSWSLLFSRAHVVFSDKRSHAFTVRQDLGFKIRVIFLDLHQGAIGTHSFLIILSGREIDIRNILSLKRCNSFLHDWWIRLDSRLHISLELTWRHSMSSWFSLFLIYNWHDFILLSNNFNFLLTLLNDIFRVLISSLGEMKWIYKHAYVCHKCGRIATTHLFGARCSSRCIRSLACSCERVPPSWWHIFITQVHATRLHAATDIRLISYKIHSLTGSN